MGAQWADSEGRILWANRAELEMFGYQRNEFVGRNLREFYLDPGGVDQIFERLLHHQKVERMEAAVRCKDGRTKLVSISANARWEGGRFVRSRIFTQDITEARLAQEAIEKMNQRLEQRLEERTHQSKSVEPKPNWSVLG